MDYKIVKKSAFKVIEKTERHIIDDSENKNTIPEFWDRSHKDGTVKKLLELSSDKEFIFGVCYNHAPTDKQSFDYSIAAVCRDDTAAPDGYRISEIPARTWAVFECIGPMPQAIQQLWHRICTEFFPTSKYKPTYEMDIEAYPSGNMTADDYRTEIWVPVVDR